MADAAMPRSARGRGSGCLTRSWHLALGDYLSLVERESVECEKDEFGEDVPDALWLIPELQLVECPGTWLTNAIKALLPQDRGGSVR